MNSLLFPFEQYWQFYAWFMLGVLALLALDLGVFHRKAHAVGIKEASFWSIIWVGLALVFWQFLRRYAETKALAAPTILAAWGLSAPQIADQVGLEFITGFLIEKSLSIDNLFIFVLVFSYFRIPAQYQHRILFYGILGALVFRAIFVALGSVLMQYHWLLVIFGLVLVVTGVKMLLPSKSTLDLSRNWALRVFQKVLPITPEIRGDRFLLRENGRWLGTPLLLALVVVEATDIIFALDSVPAIYAITREPLIVFTSNVFAILGLRSLYFLLAGVYEKFHLLKYGLGIILVFVGLKLAVLNQLYGGKFPVELSLGFIVLVLTCTILLSLKLPAKRHAAT